MKERNHLLAAVFRCVDLCSLPFIKGKTTVPVIFSALYKNFVLTMKKFENLERMFDQLQFIDGATTLLTQILTLEV